MALVLVMVVAVTGCDLFNEVDLVDENNQEELIQELSRADFFNTLITDFGELVQYFIDQTEFVELDPLEVDPLLMGELVFPSVEDLDFTAFLAHYDIYLDCREVLDEEEFKELVVEAFEDFIEDLLWQESIPVEDFNETEISVDYQYKYYIETDQHKPYIGISSLDYPQEELLIVELITIQNLSINDESLSRVRKSYLELAEYPDEFKISKFVFKSLLCDCTNLLE